MELVLLEPKTELSIAGDKISAGLVAFEERKSKLTELKDEADGLSINGVSDRDGLLKVSTVRKKIKAARVETGKEALAMRSRLTKISKDISAKEDELIAIILPSEKALQAEEDRIYNEKESIRIEAERKEQARIQKRINSLATYGYAIDLVTIQTIDDPTFEGVLNNARIEHEKELEAKAEENRLAEIEAQRVIEERKELDELRKKQIGQQKIIDEQNKRIREEQEEKQSIIQKERDRIENERKAVELQKQKEIDDKLRADELEAARIEGEKRALKLKQDNEEKEKKESEEKLLQASDKVKFQTIITQLGAIIIPEMKSRKSKLLAGEVLEMLTKVSSHILSNLS